MKAIANKTQTNYTSKVNELRDWITMNSAVKIEYVNTMNLARILSIGKHKLENAYDKLIKWASTEGLMSKQTKMITIYHDSFTVTEARKVRMSACILLNKPIERTEGIELISIEKGKFIVGNFEIKLNEFEKSWTGLFLWMNENGYKKANREVFEIYHNNFNEHPEKKAIVDFYIPILQ